MRPALPRRWWLVLDDQRLLFTELLPNWSLRSVTRSVSPANPQRPDVSGVGDALHLAIHARANDRLPADSVSETRSRRSSV